MKKLFDFYKSFLFTLPTHLLDEALTLLSDVPEVAGLADQLCSELEVYNCAMVNPSEILKDRLDTAALAVHDILGILVEASLSIP